jgi:hypothetical protein
VIDARRDDVTKQRIIVDQGDFSGDARIEYPPHPHTILPIGRESTSGHAPIEERHGPEFHAVNLL